MIFWAIEMDGQWFCMKHNCWRPDIEQDCVFDTKSNAHFFYERWLTAEQKAKAKLVPFTLTRIPEAT